PQAVGAEAVDDRPAVGAHHDHSRPAAAHHGTAQHRPPPAKRGTAGGDVRAVHALVELLGVGVAGAQLDADQRGGVALGAPCRRAPSANAKAVADGSAKPEPGSQAAAPTSRVSRPGRIASRSAGATTRVSMPIARWRATLRRRASAWAGPTSCTNPTPSKP